MAEIHATHITLNELLDHARDIFVPAEDDWRGLKDSIEHVWRYFENDEAVQQGVSTWISNFENFKNEATEDELDSLDFDLIDADTQTSVRKLLGTFNPSSARDDDLVMAISTFAETLYDFVLEYMDLSNWLGDLVSVERLGERFSFYFG